MDQDRIERGRALLAELQQNGPTGVLNEVAEVAPDFQTYIQGFVYGEVFSRTGLDRRDRLIISLSCLIMMGGVEGPIELYVEMSLDAGMSPEEIVEVMLQCVSLAGFPRVQGALLIARKVFRRRGLEVGNSSGTA
jgi:4-carboxymuconolactone decarboxylase